MDHNNPTDPAFEHLTPEHRRLAQRVYDWSKQHDLFERQTERQAINATTFARLCGPVQPSSRQVWLASTFALLFFYLDDSPHATIGETLKLSDPISALRSFSAGAAWLDDHAELRSCDPQLRSDFLTSMRGYLASLSAEDSVDPATVGVDEHWALRRRSVFVDTYASHWLVCLGIILKPEQLDRGRGARDLMQDMVILANDLGSLGRDLARGQAGDLNLAQTLSRTRGCSIDDAADSLVGHYNGLASRFMVEAASLPRGFVELLEGIVEGNVQAMLALAHRYPASASRLQQLRSCRTPR